MGRLFHQNMRKYGGNSNPRNLAFATGFGQIGSATHEACLAAGFTELLNAGDGMHVNLSGLAQELDHNLSKFVVIWVGTTANNHAEFVGIATHDVAFTVSHAGHVFRNSFTKKWDLVKIPIGDLQDKPLGAPKLFQADSRGVAFVAGTRKLDAKPYIFGFMHNMYNLNERTIPFRSLGDAAKLIRQGLSFDGYAAAEVIIGGDFNVDPDDTQSLFGRCKKDGELNVKTTEANAYDFWLVSDGNARINAHCDVHVNTRVEDASDHAGISLQI